MLVKKILKNLKNGVDFMKRRILSIMLDDLLEKVEEIKDFIFNEVESEEDLMEYIEAISYIESVINYFKLKN